MSHFAVWVVGKDIESALAPFDENDRSVLSPIKETKAELKAQFKKYNKDGEYESFEEFVSEWYGYKKRGKSWFTTYNPKSKWDWYQVGGRYSGRLAKADGIPCDTALVKELDFEKMRANARKRAEGWWEEAQRERPLDAVWLKMAFGIDPGMTREQYLDKNSRFSAFALLKGGEWYEKGSMGWWGTVSDEKDPDEWARQFDALLKSLDPEERVTIVDCHI